MEREASLEFDSLLFEMGDTRPNTERTKVSGLLTAKTSLEPIKVIRHIRKIVLDEPWNVRYVQRVIPVDIVVNTNIDVMKNEIARLSSRIGKHETFRILIEKRHCNLASYDIIRNVGSVIERKVSLGQQDWLVLIEIIGEDTAISVIRPEDIFSAVKIKRES